MQTGGPTQAIERVDYWVNGGRVASHTSNYLSFFKFVWSALLIMLKSGRPII